MSIDDTMDSPSEGPSTVDDAPACSACGVDHAADRSQTSAEILVRCLENEGVEYVFGIPGEENLEVVEALRSSRIRFVTARHEQGAAFMADVHGRLTGKAGVCLATLGPGATNLITGVADANCDGAPLVAITGQVGTDRMHLTSHQYLHLGELFEPVTKKTKQIVRPETTAEIVRIAFKHAQQEKPGACHVDLPNDIAAMRVPGGLDCDPIIPPHIEVEYPANRSIGDAARILALAQAPVVLVGHSAVRARAGEALTRFAENLRIPVLNTMMAKGAVPSDCRYSVGTVGVSDRCENAILEAADVVLAVGYDLVEFSPQKWNASHLHTVVHVDTTPAHVNKCYQPVVEVVGDISSSLQYLMEIVHRKEEPKKMLEIYAESRRDFLRAADCDSFPLRPQRILRDVRTALDRHDVVVSDVGAHKMWIAKHWDSFEPNTCIVSNGFASMGIAVPGALAAKLVYPDRNVVAMTGDGGFLMNCQELETAVRLGLAFVVLVFHDDCYGLIQQKQQARSFDDFAVTFGNPDLVRFAESFGMDGYRVTEAADLPAVIDEALASKRMALVDCPVSYGG